MSNSAVLTDEETQDKSGIGSDLIRPKFAIMNPKLTYTLPKYQLTCGIVDIFMHTIERYFTPVHGNELTDEIAEGLMRTLIRNAAKAYENQEDYDAMSEIMVRKYFPITELPDLEDQRIFCAISWDISLVQNLTKLTVQHYLQSGEAGRDTSIIWTRQDLQITEEKYGTLMRKMMKKRLWQRLRKTEEFFRSLHMPTCLGDMKMGVQPDEVLKEMAGKATAGDTMKVGAFQKMGEKRVI